MKWVRRMKIGKKPQDYKKTGVPFHRAYHKRQKLPLIITLPIQHRLLFLLNLKAKP